jgi:hypothetical protein
MVEHAESGVGVCCASTGMHPVVGPTVEHQRTVVGAGNLWSALNDWGLLKNTLRIISNARMGRERKPLVRRLATLRDMLDTGEEWE